MLTAWITFVLWSVLALQDSVVCEISDDNPSPCTSSWNATTDENVLSLWFGGELLGNVSVSVIARNLPDFDCLQSETKEWEFSQGQHVFDDEVKLCPNTKYKVSVSFECNGDSSESSEQFVWTIPAAPTNLTITNITSSGFTALWDPPHGPVTLYEVFLNGTAYKSTESNYQFTGLKADSLYIVEVSACSYHQCGYISFPVSSSTLQDRSTVLGQPINLIFSVRSNANIYIEWKPPKSSRGQNLTYTVQWNALDKPYDVFESNTTDNFILIGNLLPYSYYVTKVRAATDAETGQWSEEILDRTDIGVPYQPEDLQIVNITNSSIHLEWKEPTNSTGPIDYYVIQWKNLITDITEENSTSVQYFFLEELQPYTNYSIKLRAHTKAGLGEWTTSEIIETGVGVPHQPEDLQINRVTNSSIDLEWKKPTFSPGPIEYYVVQWKNLITNRTKEIITSEKYFRLKELQHYTNYTLRVRARTQAGFGDWTAPEIAETAVGVPHEPGDLQIIDITNSSIYLEWEKPTNSAGPIEYYVVHCKNLITNSTKEITTSEEYFTLKELQPYTNYTLRVRAHTESGFGDWTAPEIAETAVGVPHHPEGLQINNVTNTSIYFNWDEPTISSGPIDYYVVESRSLTTNFVKENNIWEVSFLLEDLHPFTNYSLRVRAHTEAGFGEWTAPEIVETDVGVPYQPEDLHSINITHSSIYLEWKEPSSATGPIQYYVIQLKKSLTDDGKEIITSEKYSLLEELQPYTNYSVRVRARTKAGLGEWTAPEIIETDVGVPNKPENLHIISVTNTSISMEWDEPRISTGPILSYVLQWAKGEGNISAEEHTTVQHFVLSNLQPYTTYSMRVRAETAAGFGAWSDQISNKTAIAAPKAALIEGVEVENSKTLLVIWRLQGTEPGPTRYDVQVFQKPSKCSTFPIEVIAGRQKGWADWYLGKHRARVEDLTPGERYYSRVILMTEAGKKKSNDSNEVQTMPEAPEAPIKVDADCSLGPTRALVSWKPPQHPNGDIVRYLIEYTAENMQSSVHLNVTDPCKNQFVVLEDLFPERPYTISVCAFVKGVDQPGKCASPHGSCVLPAGEPLLGETSYLKANRTSGTRSLVLEWSQDTFSDRMGSLVKYAILVGKAEKLVNLTSHGKSIDEITAHVWFNFSSGESDFYQATPNGWNPFEDHWKRSDPMECEVQLHTGIHKNLTILQCKIGLRENCFDNDTYCNGPLEPDTEYGLKLRGYTHGGYVDTKMLLARTASYPKTQMGSAVALGFVAILIVASLTIAAFIIRKKGGLAPLREAIQSQFLTRFKLNQVQSPMPLQQCPKISAVTRQNFSDHVQQMLADSKWKFSQEFEKLKHDSLRLPCSMAQMEENQPKNRWANILPYDDSRVKLLPLGDEPGSDYINANYVPGNSSLREYIATQGPLANTVEDFWRMVWEQGVTTIVMLTQCIERGKNKCEQYWPEQYEGGAHYGDLLVRTESESVLASYVIRIFRVQLGQHERCIRQLHFTRWPDFGCPESPEELIHFVRAVRDHMPRMSPGPVVVHCSAGVGRTGTFIVVDRLCQALQNCDRIDVYGTVLELRQHRTNMVQTEDQYIYIHMCVDKMIRILEKQRSEEQDEPIYSNIVREDTSV